MYSVDNCSTGNCKLSDVQLPEGSWMKKALFLSTSANIRATQCAILEEYCKVPGRKQAIVDVLTRSVGYSFLKLINILKFSSDWQLSWGGGVERRSIERVFGVVQEDDAGEPLEILPGPQRHPHPHLSTHQGGNREVATFGGSVSQFRLVSR